MANSPKRFLDDDLASNFPNLTRELYEVTSEATPLADSQKVPPYNCIAFAAGDCTCWWEPDPYFVYFWPKDVRRDYDVESYIEAFESLAYRRCDNAAYEAGFEKVAIYYTRLGNPDNAPGSGSHAALQTRTGTWRSKLGQWEDIEHRNLECLNGEDPSGETTPYGEPCQILKRLRA
jgi:hypothetical protein